jgi:hypothetical protein
MRDNFRFGCGYQMFLAEMSSYKTRYTAGFDFVDDAATRERN